VGIDFAPVLEQATDSGWVEAAPDVCFCAMADTVVPGLREGMLYLINWEPQPGPGTYRMTLTGKTESGETFALADIFTLE
jgi:hypothetical protein